ncbi:hypothetical protein LPJ66_008471, partial [Kickxella alabastrina]
MSKDRARAEHWARSSADRTATTRADSALRDNRLTASNTQSSGLQDDASNICSRTIRARPRSWLRRIAVIGLLVAAAVSPALAADSSGSSVSTTVAVATGPISTATPLRSASESELDEESELESDGDSSNEAESAEESDISGLDTGDNEDDGGGIGIVGGFSGVSSFSPDVNSPTLSLNNSLTSVVALSTDSASLLGSYTATGQVTAGCSFYNKDGSISQSFFGGTLNSLDSKYVGYVAGLDSDGLVDTMNGGVDGPINALYCDQGTQQVFVGGSFTSTVEGMTSSIVTMRSSSTGGIA